MFIILGKLLAPLSYPLGLSFSLWVAAGVLCWRGARHWGRRCTLGGMAVVLGFSNPIAGRALLGSLEDDYPVLAPEACPRAGAIVVLGGSTALPIPPRSGIEVGDSFDRLLHGMRLWRAGKAPLLVLSGGVIAFMAGSELSEAERMRQLALEYGVDPEAILLEKASRNTYENAAFTRRLLERRGIERILLVTSAGHMPRAAAAFRTQGLEILPAPTDVRVVPKPFTPLRFLPSVEALHYSTMAVKEYVGLVVYRLLGWIS